ncbi:Lrp/AsnC family transcriptional regulator [Alteromonas sediminis]|uniref:Lrp/AsnC family transcriptional regulator n=1 Tax=Alteromonas sediminis TaxID=2259342 RepID=UPI001F0C65F3|nr:Lrp/AsnC family transcriptional regulator [Alteromonas sediminis]
MDSIDKKLLAALENDARQSFSALGECVGLSKTPCWNRVKALNESGVVQSYGARLDPEKLGIHIKAIVHVVVDFAEYQAFESAIIAHRQVRSCQAVTGEFDYVLEVFATNMGQFDELLRNQLSQLPGVQRFNTAIATRSVKVGAPYTGMMI